MQEIIIPVRRISRVMAIHNAHKIMDDGKFKSCQKQAHTECGRCCKDGSIIFPEEETEEIPAGIKIINGRVLNCLDPKRGCRFPKKQKPLLCKMSPILAGARVESCRREIMFMDEFSPGGCPANIPDDFRERVQMAIFQLMLGGIWIDNHAIMREDPVDAEILRR